MLTHALSINIYIYIYTSRILKLFIQFYSMDSKKDKTKMRRYIDSRKVFQINRMSFSGLPFIGLETPILVWRGWK